MRIGIFGGSFDPVHVGHEAFVEIAIRELGLDKVFVIPTAVSPFKIKTPPAASGEHRSAMLKLAFEGNRKVEVLTVEVDRGGVSYTIDTVRALKKEFPNDKFFLLLTEEARSTLANWKDVNGLQNIAEVVFLGQRTQINSTEVRRNSALRKEFLSTKVLDYIERHRLYSS